jgi:hypothetical protein
MLKSESGHNLDDIEFAESKLAESRDRLKKFRDLHDSFFAGQAERDQTATIIDEIENLHRLLDQLCHRLRGRPH